ncbi:MAG: adenosine deaminase [Bifidobacteriaceae bacterium]|jgi:adenosine deaminase|nr:adenosine deaminase [Bifidobacteriaceae bacterium]
MLDLKSLPKAHLHLHFAGSMKESTLRDLSKKYNISIPEKIYSNPFSSLPSSRRGWHLFQKLYDVALSCIKTEADFRRIIIEAADNDMKDGSKRLELQINPNDYLHIGKSLEGVLELALDQAKLSSRDTGVEIAIIVATSRTASAKEAEKTAQVASNYVGEQAGQVVAFGLSNDELAGRTKDFKQAFAIAKQAGLYSVPHGGELLGDEHIWQIVRALKPDRIGHGVRATVDHVMLEKLADDEIALEVCPTSNVALGVFQSHKQVPIRELLGSGVRFSINADDPLLFKSRLLDQYKLLRDVNGLFDREIIRVAKMSISSSFATYSQKTKWLKEIDNIKY